MAREGIQEDGSFTVYASNWLSLGASGRFTDQQYDMRLKASDWGPHNRFVLVEADSRGRSWSGRSLLRHLVEHLSKADSGYWEVAALDTFSGSDRMIVILAPPRAELRVWCDKLLEAGFGGFAAKPCAGGIPEVSLRLSKERCVAGTGVPLKSPTDALGILRKVIGKDAAQESFVAVYVGPANNVLATQVVALGGLDQSAVDPRVLLSGALLAGASAMIVGHNHPSGNVSPSAADDSLTQQLVQASRLTSIRLLDHIVFSDDADYSYLQHGRIQFNTR